MDEKLKKYLNEKIENGLSILSKSEIEKQKGNYSESNKLYSQWVTIKNMTEELYKLHGEKYEINIRGRDN